MSFSLDYEFMVCSDFNLEIFLINMTDKCTLSASNNRNSAPFTHVLLWGLSCWLWANNCSFGYLWKNFFNGTLLFYLSSICIVKLVYTGNTKSDGIFNQVLLARLCSYTDIEDTVQLINQHQSSLLSSANVISYQVVKM